MKNAARTIAVLLLGTALMAALVLSSFWSFRQIREAADARRHTYEMMRLADAYLSALRDAETGHRGYSLTGDEVFLKPYLAVRDGVRGQLEELRQLSGITAARKYLDALVPLTDAKLAEMTHVVELRRSNDAAGAMALVNGGQSRLLMDSIRTETGGFIRIQEVALAQREAAFQSDMSRMFATIVAVSLFVLLCALLFAYLIYRETRYRLTKLVHQETQHLLEIQEETNKQLQHANVTLQVSEEKLAVTLNSIGDAVIATDAEGRVTLLNPLAEKLTGWTLAEAAGRKVDEIFHIINQETREPATVPVKETLARGTIQGLANHTVLIARDGSECSIADSCAPIRERDGHVVGAVLVFRDVTEEYAVQQALRDKGALIQTVLNTVMDGIITLHANGGIVETVNPAAERMFGYTAAELVGHNFSMLIPELEQDSRNSSLEYYSASDEARTNGLGREVVGRRKDGGVFPMEMAVSEMWLGGKRYFTGILRDISARRRAEDALLKVGALQAAIFNSANFSSIATDAKGVIQIFNVGAERMLGYAAAEVMDKITPADISDPHELIARAKALSTELGTPITPGFEALVFKAKRGIEDIYELTYIRKDGSRFPAVVSVTALRDAQNAIIGYLLIGTDNTARKQIEIEQKRLDQRLRDQQFYTRSLIESNIDAIMTTDLSSIITDVNKQMESLTGCTRDELIGAPFKNYFTDPEQAEASINLVLIKKKVKDYELTVLARDRRETVVSFNANTFYDRNRTLQGVFATARDVTERKRNEKALQEKNVELQDAKLVADKANLAKSDFLSSMSHELRSPLNAILGFAQLMESASPLPTDSQRENITQILEAGWHLLKLINEILDLAVIESGRVSLSPESVSLSELMSECQAMMETQANQRRISMTFPRFDKPLFVRADRTRMKQILINLLSNAIKYNKERGTVLVSCTVTAPERIRISVKDSGDGLPLEKLAQLFQPFNRLGQEAGGVAGTGIGLVVTKQLAELMGGVIGVESTVGEGSEFWCELTSVAAPQLDMKNSEVEAFALPKLPAGEPRRTLLYVEDNPANMMMVEQLIARYPDIRLETAVNGTLGIERARALRPNVILMDINLPGISGIEALKILREDPDTAHIPVVAISANAMHRDIEKGLEAGFFSYITKPFKVKEFMKTLNLALEFAAKGK